VLQIKKQQPKKCGKIVSTNKHITQKEGCCKMSITYTTAKRKKICDYELKHGKMKAYEMYGASRPTIDRWLSRYDGTKMSLKEKSRRPHSHPKESTKEEVKLIVGLWHKNKEFGLDYLYGKLIREHNYTRSRGTVYNVLRREGLVYKPNKKKRKRSNKPYNGATIPGQKMQMDVKYVPKECMTEQQQKEGLKYYQWTIIDEATSLRFMYWYNSKEGANSVDFVQRAMKYFPFKIKEIQTDNGSEFTNRFLNTKALSELDEFLNEVKINHKLIRPATPWHNGRVERSHRTDDKFFYNYLSFYDLNDLRNQGKVWLRKYQNMYQRKYNYLSPLEVWKEYKSTGLHPIYDYNAMQGM
jgi:transposase InsO family protein